MSSPDWRIWLAGEVMHSRGIGQIRTHPWPPQLHASGRSALPYIDPAGKKTGSTQP